MTGAVRGSGAPICLTNLAIREFRNLARVELQPAAAGVALVGENGHGKTNLLEAIYYLQILRSARGARDQDLVRFGSAGFHVGARVVAGDAGPREIGVGYERAGRRKRVRLDGVEVPRLADALGHAPAVLVSPADIVLVAGGPGERRRYLDIVLALTSPRYLTALQGYRAALLRRNAALRDAARAGLPADDARITCWEPMLAEHGAVLWTERAAWAERVAGEFAHLTSAIGERGEARLRYAAHHERGGDARAALEEALGAQRGQDVRRGMTHAGPHRDDLALTLDGRELRVFGSAGQQRTAAMALRLLEANTLRERHGGPPMLLLDDPFAELDTQRARRMLALLRPAGGAGVGQTFIAVPRAEDVPGELTELVRWRVEDGVVRTEN